MSCILSFKQEAKVYIVYNNMQYNIDVSEISFGQTFTEHSYSNKTIQVQNMFEQSVINKANPANFEFTFPALQERDMLTPFNRALDCGIFDLYISTEQDIFKVENCVITNASFIIMRDKPLSMSISGQGAKLTRFTEVIPGTIVARSATRTYSRINYTNAIIGGKTIDSLKSINIELQNEVKWTPYTTVNEAIDVVNAANSMYPKGFTIAKKVLAGSLTTTIMDDLEWGTETALHIEAGYKSGAQLYGFDINSTDVSFTTSPRTDDLFTHNYSWRMTQNPTNLSEVITYIIAISFGNIQDSFGIDILDFESFPIIGQT